MEYEDVILCFYWPGKASRQQGLHKFATVKADPPSWGRYQNVALQEMQ